MHTVCPEYTILLSPIGGVNDHPSKNASSVKCVDIHLPASLKAAITYLCNDPNNILYKYFKTWNQTDGLLALKRRPFEVLLTPFWSPIKHLFLLDLITNWFTVGCRLAFYACFCLYLQVFFPKLCHDFSRRCLPFQSIDMKSFSVSEDDNKVGSQDRLAMFLFNAQLRFFR